MDKEGGQLGPLFYAVENAQLHRHDQRESLCGGVDLPTPSSKEALCEQYWCMDSEPMPRILLRVEVIEHHSVKGAHSACPW